MRSLTVFHQCTVQLSVRLASVDIILLDFDAIAGEFVSLRERPRSGIGRGLDGLANRTVARASERVIARCIYCTVGIRRLVTLRSRQIPASPSDGRGILWKAMVEELEVESFGSSS